MTDTRLCMNCEAIAPLDQHGRCSVCGSDAVDLSVLGTAVVAQSLRQLAREAIRQHEIKVLERMLTK